MGWDGLPAASQGTAHPNYGAGRRSRRHVRCSHPQAPIQQGPQPCGSDEGANPGAGNSVRSGSLGPVPQPPGDGADRRQDDCEGTAGGQAPPPIEQARRRQCARPQVSMAERRRRAAAAGSLEPKTPAIEATPDAPAAIGTAAFSAVTPPMATAGRLTAFASRENPSGPSGAPASSFELVP